MKKQLLLFLFAIVASVGTMFASTKIGNLYYNLNSTNKTAEVTYKSYADYTYNKGWNITTADIPASVTYSGTTYSVTSIGSSAFKGCSGLTSVTIPNSVTSIGEGAFSRCTSLTSVTIPNSVTSIGSHAFNGCSSLTSPVYNSHVFAFMPTSYSGAYTIPDGIESIAGGAFVICSSLTSVTIPNSVTSIGNYAFQNCSGLTSVTIGNSVTSIGEMAFYNCSGLTSVTIPNGVTSIGEEAFSNCSSLTSVTIPNSVTSIRSGAFSGCSGLTSIEIPNSVTSIGDYAFYGCSGLTSVMIPNSVTSIGDYAFSRCSSLPVVDNLRYADTYLVEAVDKTLSSYTIKDGTRWIGVGAFNGCSSLTSVTIPNSVTSIGNGAFSGCGGLTRVNINDIAAWCNIAFYGGAANPLSQAKHLFVNDVEVTDLVIPNSVTRIGGYAFRDCSSLTSVTIPNSVTSIGWDAFRGCSSLTSVTIPNSVTSIGNYAFQNCSGLTSVTIGNSVTSIGELAFYNCSGLTSVTIPNSVTSIGSSAFSGCSGLTSVTLNSNAIVSQEYSTNISIGNLFGPQVKEYIIGEDVTSIGNYAFYNRTGLTSVTIGNSVTSIGDWAFYGCTGLTSVTIPNSVTSIGIYAFKWCRSLTSVTIGNSVTSIGYEAFNGCSSLTAIYVPCGEMERFKQMLNNDSRINDHAPLPYTITINATNGNVAYPQTICDDMLLNATPDYGYHFVKWSDGVTDNPRTIELTQDTTFTAEFAYDRVGTCGKDLALVWSYDQANKVLTIGNAGEFTENMQFGAEAPAEMEELVIGNNVTAIGENAFAGISTLKKVTIGESVKTIYDRAFYNCVNLETIFNYRPTPTNAYSTAFEGVDKFECILYVLPNSIDMYKNASVWRDFYYTYAIGAEEATVTTNEVMVEPQDNAATLTWPTSNEAASYTIEITKDGVVFCRLIFNANGQLTGIAFAPGRDGQSMAPAAIMTASGLQFTVTGLNSNTKYGYSLTAKDANEQPIATYSGSFTTTSEGVATGIGNTAVEQKITKILHNGEVLILRDGKTYTVQGLEVK